MNLPAFALSIVISLPLIIYFVREALRSSQNISQNKDKTDRYSYPTDFTQDIIPPFHSHNDYWREKPFYSALSYGAISIEADVWFINGTLYVGHELSALTKTRTLASLYVQPLLDTLHKMNPQTPFTQQGGQNGVFDTSSSQTLFLFIDLKTAADETWPAVLAALEPLRTGDWLTVYDGKVLHLNPVTIVGTGNTQYSDVKQCMPRHVFWDAPLAQLDENRYLHLTSQEAPFASTDFQASFGWLRRRELSDSQLTLLRKQLDVAHKKGIKTRYWNQPEWPIGTRNAIWRLLWDEGVDLLNANDVQGAAEFWTSSG